MSCWLRQTVSVEWTGVNPERVNEVIRNTRHDFRDAQISYRNGKLTIETTDDQRAKEIERRLKVEYGKATVKDASKKFGWELSEPKINKAGRVEYAATKRR